jgi:hypothetical protein
MNATQGTTVTSDETALLERFMLARLERFARIASAATESGVPQWRRLARHAVFSTYRDCLDLGLVDSARSIVAAAR